MVPIVTTTVVRPDIGLVAILGYAFFAFLLGLALTPWFIAFLRRNSLGKQLRVETVDGRDPTIFRQYHEKKFGTPTMGGLLIWGSMILTIAFSRVLSYLGVVQNSLLQRGQVYVPMFVLFTMGILGALDDYLNIVSGTPERTKEAMPTIKRFSLLGGFLSLLAVLGLFLSGGFSFQLSNTGKITLVAVVLIFLAIVLVMRTSATVLFQRFMLSQGKRKGLGVWPKLTSFFFISLIGALWFYGKLGHDSIYIPFHGDFHVGLWYIPIFMLVLIGTVNAVNVTDGLDGLAGGLLVIAFGGFGILAYLQGLHVLAGFCAVAVGAIGAFLWHNVPPALFFMGDTGALALGGALAVIAFMTDQVLLLPLLGFVFVIEMLSVIIQLTSKKLRGGKKVFRAAPLHHHFEALEWGESKVTMRLWIIGAIAAVLGVIIGLSAVKNVPITGMTPSVAEFAAV
jgi:phospho-N-acetylmuramoyl-pentapeptide-transferase